MKRVDPPLTVHVRKVPVRTELSARHKFFNEWNQLPSDFSRKYKIYRYIIEDTTEPRVGSPNRCVCGFGGNPGVCRAGFPISAVTVRKQALNSVFWVRT